MDALIIFGDDNEHPLRFLLNKKHRHVWCAVKLDQYWVSYNWHQGNPIINVDQAADFDLASFYREQGFEVIETTVGDEPCHGPWMCNNCVGHTMVICGIRAHHIYTPHQLWKHLTGRTMFDNIRNFFHRCEFIPGFGGGKTVFLPAPPTTTTAPPSQTTIDADAKLAADERARLRAQKTAAGAATDLSSTLLSDEDSGTGGALT